MRASTRSHNGCHWLVFSHSQEQCSWMFFLFRAFSWQKPCATTWGNGLEAMKHALVLEKDVYQALLDLHNTAARNEDPQVGSIHSIRALFDWVLQAITTFNQKKGKYLQEPMRTWRKNNESARKRGWPSNNFFYQFSIWLVEREVQIFCTKHRVRWSKNNTITNYFQLLIKNLLSCVQHIWAFKRAGLIFLLFLLSLPWITFFYFIA